MVRYIFRKLANLNTITIVSEKYSKADGYYFDIKMQGVLEPIPILARVLLSQYYHQINKTDIQKIIEAVTKEKRYALLCLTDKEFVLLDRHTNSKECRELNYCALKCYPENALEMKDIIKISSSIERENIKTNTQNMQNYMKYEHGNVIHLVK